MIAPKDLKKAYLELLRKEFPNIRLYGTATVEGYTLPSFFVRFIGLSVANKITKNVTSNVYLCETTYFQHESNEADGLEKVERIRGAVGDYLTVGEKKILIKDFDYSFTGKNNDIVQITFQIEFYAKADKLKKPGEDNLMEEVIVNYNCDVAKGGM